MLVLRKEILKLVDVVHLYSKLQCGWWWASCTFWAPSICVRSIKMFEMCLCPGSEIFLACIFCSCIKIIFVSKVA